MVSFLSMGVKMNLSKKVSAKFETKMAEKGWSFEKTENGKQYLDGLVQEFYEIFVQGYMSAPVWDNGFHVIARITDKGLQFGETPHIHFKKSTADRLLRYHAHKHGKGFIALSGLKMHLKELEKCMGRKVHPNKKTVHQEKQPEVVIQEQPKTE